MPILLELQNHVSAIAAMDPLSQSVPIELAGWRSKIGSFDVWKKAIARATTLGWALGNKLSLSRKNLVDLSACDVCPEITFMLDMLWGYGSGNGRSHSTVFRMLSDAGLSDALRDGRAAVLDADYQRAFKIYKSIEGLGMSFVTKILYFESRAADSSSYVPIFDDRVAKRLLRLAVVPGDEWLCDSLACGRGNDWTAYEVYFRNLRGLAKSLGVELEQLEYWLFL